MMLTPGLRWSPVAAVLMVGILPGYLFGQFGGPKRTELMIPFTSFESGSFVSKSQLRKMTSVSVISPQRDEKGLSTTSRMQETDWAQLERAKSLRTIAFYWMNFPPEQLNCLKHHKQLKELIFQNTLSLTAKLKAVRDLPTIEGIRIIECEVDKEAGKHLSKMKHLKHLIIERCWVDTNFLKEHPLPEGLLKLVIDGENLLMTNLMSVTKFPKTLTHLEVYGTVHKPRDADMPDLSVFRDLKELTLYPMSHYEQGEWRKKMPKVKINGATLEEALKSTSYLPSPED